MVPFSNANADELKSFLLKFTDAKDYPYELLEENYRAFIKIEENYISVGKQELKKLYDAQAKEAMNKVVQFDKAASENG